MNYLRQTETSLASCMVAAVFAIVFTGLTVPAISPHAYGATGGKVASVIVSTFQ